MRNFLARLILVMLCLGFGVALYKAKAQGAGGALVVSTCGTLPSAYTPGATRQLTVDVNGQVCQ